MLEPSGALGVMAAEVSSNAPTPASFTAATRNSYGRPSVSPFTVKVVSLTSPGLALKLKKMLCSESKLRPIHKVSYKVISLHRGNQESYQVSLYKLDMKK